MVCIQVYGDVLKDGHQVKGDGLQKFIKEEKETNTGLIDKKIENNLNDLGVFDSEIEQFDDETLSLLNCGYDYHVDVVYYDETDDGLKKMSDNEVENYFNVIYADGRQDELHDGKVLEKVKENKKNSILEKLGLEETAYAESSIGGNTGKIKFVLVAIQTSSTEVSIRAMAEWKENPKYRGNDYIGTYIQDDDVYFEDGEKNLQNIIIVKIVLKMKIV